MIITFGDHTLLKYWKYCISYTLITLANLNYSYPMNQTMNFFRGPLLIGYIYRQTALEISCVKYQRDCQAKLKSLKSLHKIVVQLNCWKIYCKVNQLLHHLISYFQLNVNSQVILYSGRDPICFSI